MGLDPSLIARKRRLVYLKQQMDQAIMRNMYRLAKRNLEGMSLYDPLPMARQFHRSSVRIGLLDGPNQSGKSLMGAMEFSWRITGTHPFKKVPKGNQRALICGPKTDHIADPIWKYLSQPGAFSVINDEITGRLRSVRADPNDPTRLDPYDEAYKEKWRDAPPLLPDRWIADISYESVVDQAPHNVKLVNDTTLMFRTAGGNAKPPRGGQLIVWWFDEEIPNPTFLTEVTRGCMRYGGTGFWSATPESGGMQLHELHERALMNDPDVRAFTVYLEDNPFISDADKLAFYNSLTEEQREVKYYGHYLLKGRQIYKVYDPNIHNYHANEMPLDWCYYIFVDPGHISGTVFAAVDPDEKHLWIYKSVELRECTAQTWADMVWREHYSRPVEAIVMDERAGRQTGIGGGPTVALQYRLALKERGIVPQAIGPLDGFMPGTPNIEAREEALIRMLSPRLSGPFMGTPKLQMAFDRNGKLEAQIRRAHKEAKNPEKRARDAGYPDDLVQALEYGAHYNPSYHYNEPIQERSKPGVLDALQRLQDQQRRQRGPTGRLRHL